MTDTPRGGTRRSLLGGARTGVAATGLAGCDKLAASPAVNDRALNAAEGLTFHVQRLSLGRSALAREYPPSAIAADFKANG